MARMFVPYKPITVRKLIEQLQALNMPDAPVAVHNDVVEAQGLLQNISICNTNTEAGLPYDKGDNLTASHPQLRDIDIVFLSALGIVGSYKEE